LKKWPAIVIIVLGAAAGAAAQPAAGPGPVALVTRVYQDYAGAAVIDSSEFNQEDLFGRSKAVMARYLDDGLIALVLADRACSAKTQEICNLDFLPIWDGQDPGGATVRIAATKNPARVSAELRYGSDTVHHLTYVLVKTAAGWRIHDIEYDSHESLLKILRAKPGS
jgi:hypothetical protein